MSLDTFYRNGIYEALRQSSPEVENGEPIILDGQHLLDMAGAVFDYLNSLPVVLAGAESEADRLRGALTRIRDYDGPEEYLDDVEVELKAIARAALSSNKEKR